jgi:assimilatory nitrate reductase catalytic subunit
MARRLLKDGDLVYVTSKRGSIVVPLQASPEVAVSQAFIAMHWGEEYLSGQSTSGATLAGVNAITTSAYCPTSRQPELKHAAVKILKAQLSWTLLALAWLPAERALATREQLKAMMALFPFASCVPFANDTPLEQAATKGRTGVLFRAAAYEAPPDEVLRQLEGLLGLAGADALRYADRRKGQRRTIAVQRQGADLRIEALLLAGDTSAESWLKPLLLQELPAQSYGRQLLSPSGKAPVAVPGKGKQVCACFGVAAPAIEKHVAGCAGSPDDRLASLQSTLRCGTNCGSCVPELKRMIRAIAPLQAA